MKHRSFLNQKERVDRSKLAKLVHDRFLICGSTVEMARTCGKQGCKCAKGEKHVSLYLATKKEGKRKMIFIPAESEQTIRAWIANYNEIYRLLESLSEEALKRFEIAKANAKKERK